MRAIRYGAKAAARRRRQLALPTLTTAAGAALLTVVLSSFPAIRREGASFGDPAALAHTTEAISILVVLVAAIEVAICATRSVTQRREEIGVLSANGIAPRSVLVSLMIEPGVCAAIGGVIGALLGAIGLVILRAGGSLGATAPVIVARSGAIALLLATAASLLASLLPVLRAVRKPPLASLTSAR
jgi:hypothetical protein